MPTVGSITKTVRLNPRDLAVIEKIMEGGASWSGAVHILAESYGGSLHGIDERDLEELEGVAFFMGGSVGEMVHAFTESAVNGEVYFEDGKMVYKQEVDLREFLATCKELRLSPRKIIKQLTEQMREESGLNPRS